MPRPQATFEQREKVRRTIRNAAAELYRAEGLGAISARSVALRAGVSVGTIYAHFGDLTGLMQSLWTGKVERQNARFSEIASEIPDPLARLRALLDAYLIFGIENAELYRNAFLFVRPEAHGQPDRSPLDSQPFPRLLLDALRDAQALGHIVPGDVAVIAQLLWSGLHGLLALPNNLDRLEFRPPADLRAPMIDALLRAVVVQAR